MNLLTISQTFSTEDQALDYWVKTRWPKGVRCIACDHAKVYSIATSGKTGKPCRLFECAACGLHFSAITGTLFHDSHLPLRKWFMAMALMCAAKKGISANQVARHLGCQYKTAWYLCHRIRKAMEELNSAPIGGQGKIVEVDETFVGGRKLGKGHKAAVDAKIWHRRARRSGSSPADRQSESGQHPPGARSQTQSRYRQSCDRLRVGLQLDHPRRET